MDSAQLLKSDNAELWEMKNNKISTKAFERLYLDEKTADVRFICGPEAVRIPAHKCILSKASPVFDAMFYGKNATPLDKEYPETSPDTFKEFLKLCYCAEFVLIPNHIIDVIELAHEFQMFESVKNLGELWADNMTIDDVCSAYQCAIHLEMGELEEFCERRISLSAKQIFETPHFLSCNRIVFDRILDMETLVCDEKCVLQACLSWARKACERDGVIASDTCCLGPCLKESLYKIRFGAMTLTDVGEMLDKSGGLFTDAKDYEDIIRLTTKIGKAKTGRFNSHSRSSKIPWIEKHAIEWKVFNPLDVQRRSIQNDKCLTMTMRSTQPVLLGGFHWAPLESPFHTAEVTVTIQQQSDIVHTEDIELYHNMSPCLDLAKSPIMLQANLEYEIFFKFSLTLSNMVI